jgi:hypothetical protein
MWCEIAARNDLSISGDSLDISTLGNGGEGFGGTSDEVPARSVDMCRVVAPDLHAVFNREGRMDVLVTVEDEVGSFNGFFGSIHDVLSANDADQGERVQNSDTSFGIDFGTVLALTTFEINSAEDWTEFGAKHPRGRAPGKKNQHRDNSEHGDVCVVASIVKIMGIQDVVKTTGPDQTNKTCRNVNTKSQDTQR